MLRAELRCNFSISVDFFFLVRIKNENYWPVSSDKSWRIAMLIAISIIDSSHRIFYCRRINSVSRCIGKIQLIHDSIVKIKNVI